MTTVTFLIPTIRGTREEGLARCIASIRNMDYPQSDIQVVVLDQPGTVPEKINQGVANCTTEWVAFAANDIEYTKDCLKHAMYWAQYYPLVAFDEGFVGFDSGNICTHFMIKRDFIHMLDGGLLFCPEFNHIGVDNYLWAQCVKMKACVHVSDARIIHHHFSNGRAIFDETYQIGWKKADQDRELLKKKLAALRDEP